MPGNVKTIRAYLIRSFCIAGGAVLFWLMTYSIIWNNTDGNMFIAYIANGIIIIAATAEDKLRFNYLRKKRKAPFKSKILSVLFDYVILQKHDLTSMKSSLYLFYVFALISSHMLIINPYLEVSESIRNYFSTVSYGLLLLVVADKFSDQLVKEDRRIKAYENDNDNK